MTSAAIKDYRKAREAKTKRTYLAFSRLSAALKDKVKDPKATAAAVGMAMMQSAGRGK